MSIVAIAGPLVAGKVVSEVLEDVQAKLQQMAMSLSNIANNLADDLLSQVEVTAKEIIEELNDVAEELIEDLDDKVKRKLYAVVASVEKMRIKLSEDVVDISKDFNRDIRQTLAKVSFIGEIYALDTVDNTLIPFNHKGDWTLIAKGVGIGFDSEDVASEATLYLNANRPDEIEITGLEISDTEVHFTIPSNIIEDTRDKYKTEKIFCLLRFNITEDRGLWFDKHFEVSQPVILTTAPDFVANIDVQTVTPIMDWVRREELDITSSKWLPSGHATSSSDIVYHHTKWTMDLSTNLLNPRIDDLKFVGTRDGGCNGDGCTYRKYHALNVVNGGKRINIHHENWSHEIQIHVIGEVARYERVGDDINDSSFEVFSSDTLDVELKKGFQTVRIEGRTRNGRSINLTIERNTHTDNYPIPEGDWGNLSFKGVTQLTNSVVYHLSYSDLY